MTLEEMDRYLQDRGPAYVRIPVEVLADKGASVQAVISLLELLREKGASQVTLGTVLSTGRDPTEQ